MTDPGERIELPSGAALYYVDENHSYWRCKSDGSRGKRLTGVTTAIKPIDFEKDRLLSWAARTQCIGIAELANNGDGQLGWLDSQESIWKELEAHDLTFEKVRDKAAKRGTNVHELALRALASGRPVPDFEAMTDEEKGYAKAVAGFWLDYSPKPLQVEQVVVDDDLGVAGRFDLRATLDGWGEGPGIVDLKTSKWVGEKDHVQVALYAHLAALCGLGESDWTAILQVREDGSYELIDGQAVEADALAAVDLYRRRGRIRGAAAKAYKQRQKELA